MSTVLRGLRGRLLRVAGLSTVRTRPELLFTALLSAHATACGHGSGAHDEHAEPVAPHRTAGGSVHAAAGAPGRAPRRATLPDPATSSEVTLNALLDFADVRSPVLQVARSTRSRAEAAHVAASVLLPGNPELSLAAGPRVTEGGTGVDFTASISQRLAIAGERGLRLDAADRLAELTDAEIEQLRWGVHCDVHAAFHEVLVLREQAALADRVRAFQQDLLRIVERQIAAGETAPLTLRLAQAEAAQAQQAAVAARQRHYAARIQLAQLSGWPAERPPTPVGALDAPRDPPDLGVLLALARKRLPLLAARDAAVREAQARVVAADRASWTQPTVGAQYSRESSGGGAADHVVLGTLSLPLPTFERNQGARASARADLRVARAELEAAKSLLGGTLARARSEVVAAAERVRSYGSEVIPRLEENLTMLRRAFELGDIDLLELSIGRERFLRIQNDAYLAHLDYFVALAGLERASGADVWPDEHHEEQAP